MADLPVLVILRGMMNAHKRSKGISRIDQPEKRTHGFFVRLQRRGKIYSGFFADKTHGGQPQALAAAQKHYQKLLRKHRPLTRQLRAQIRRRKGSSGIVGVQRVIVRRPGYQQAYWKATWSPQPYVVRTMMFSTRKYGARWAKALAIRVRKAELRSMAA